MKFIITGFGPFGQITSNPSRIIANEVVQQLNNSKMVEAEFVDLKASINDVEHFYSNLSNSEDVFVLHIGLYAGIRRLHLEYKAINNAEFQIPDAENEQPRNTAIDKSKPLDNQLTNTLPVPDLARKNLQFELSEDCGTYICNYTYYRALQFAGNKTKGTLFIHCALFQHIPLKTQVDHVISIISNLNRFFNK